MELIQQLMGGLGDNAMGGLLAKGFDQEQASNFLPAALESITGSLGGVDVQSLANADEGTQVSSLMDKIDLGQLAGLLGGNEKLAGAGLTALIPQVLGFLKDNEAAAGLLGMLNGGGGGGLAGLAKGLFR